MIVMFCEALTTFFLAAIYGMGLTVGVFLTVKICDRGEKND